MFSKIQTWTAINRQTSLLFKNPVCSVEDRLQICTLSVRRGIFYLSNSSTTLHCIMPSIDSALINQYFFWFIFCWKSENIAVLHIEYNLILSFVQILSVFQYQIIKILFEMYNNVTFIWCITLTRFFLHILVVKVHSEFCCSYKGQRLHWTALNVQTTGNIASFCFNVIIYSCIVNWIWF